MGAEPAQRVREVQHEPTPSFGSAPTRALLAGFMLIALEMTWLRQLDYHWSPARVALLATPLMIVALLVEMLVGGAVLAARGLSRRLAPLLLTLLALPAIGPITESLFSGGAVSSLSAIGVIKVAFAVLFASGVAVGALWSLRLLDGRWLHSRGVSILIVAAVVILTSWIDSHQQVGLYPAFHFVLASLTALSAVLLAHLLVPSRLRVPAGVGGTSASLLGVALFVSGLGWNSVDTMSLVTSSNGLLPKVREGSVAALDLALATRADVPPSAAARDGSQALAGSTSETSGQAATGDAPALTSDADDLDDLLDEWVQAHREATAPANLLVAVDALDDGAAWRTAGGTVDVSVDVLPSPQPERQADVLHFGATSSIFIQETEHPADRKFEARLWVKAVDVRPGATMDVLLMASKDGAYERTVVQPTAEWTEVSVKADFRDALKGGTVRLRLGNNHADPHALAVAIWNPRVFEDRPPAPPATAWNTEGEAFLFAPTTGEAAERIRQQTANVVFVLMDAFRQDHVGPRDGAPSLTPFLDSLSLGAAAFPTTYSPSDHTGRSLPSIQTGLPLGVVRKLSELDVPMATWIDVLRQRGFRTFANGASDYVSRKYPNLTLSQSHGVAEESVTDGRKEAMIDELGAFIGRDASAPFAVFSHWCDTHVHAGAGMAERYAEAVRTSDRRLERLFGLLESAGVLDNTLVVITSDHGYMLGESNRFLGSQGTVEMQVRVPLVMHVPGLPVPAFDAAVTSSHAIAPTILDCLAPDAAFPQWQQSLLPRMLGQAPRDVSDAVAMESLALNSDGDSTMLRRGPHKIVRAPKLRMTMAFDLESESGEGDILGARDLTAQLDALLDTVLERQDRCSATLVARHRVDIDARILDLLVLDEPGAQTVRPVLADFWALGPSSRRLLLETIITSCAASLRPELRGLARDSWEQDDQLLLVTRARADDDVALAALVEAWPRLTGTARRRFAEILGLFETEFVSQVADGLTDQVLAVADTQPALGSDDERFMTLAAHGLALQLGEQTPAAIKAVLIERFNAWDSVTPRYSIPTLGEQQFLARNLLAGIERCIGPEDLRLLGKLGGEFYAHRMVINRCAAIGSDDAWTTIQRRLQSEANVKIVDKLIPNLRRIEDPAVLAEIDRQLRGRFPDFGGISNS